MIFTSLLVQILKDLEKMLVLNFTEKGVRDSKLSTFFQVLVVIQLLSIRQEGHQEARVLGKGTLGDTGAGPTG